MTSLSELPACRPTAFVLGLGENGYAILRQLAAAKIPVVGCYDDPLQVGRFSSYCKPRYLDLSAPDSQLCQTLIDLRMTLADKPVLFVTADEYALLLAKHREILSPHFAYHWLQEDSVSRVIDKARMSQVCQAAGILCPRTHITQAGEDLAESLRDFPFPCLVKPVRSFKTGFPSQEKNFVAHSPDALRAFYDRHPGMLGLTIWQEIIEGEDDEVFQCTTFVRDSGEFGPLFVVRKIHQYPPGYGSMCYGRSEENQCVADITVSLLRFLDYRGFASLEFKRRTRDGLFYFIEINPRLPWYNSLFSAAGVNFPLLAYRDLSDGGHPQNLDEHQKNDIYWVSLEHEFLWLMQTRNSHRVNLFRWLQAVGKAQSFAWWSWRDLGPFLHLVPYLLGHGLWSRIRSLGSTEIRHVESVAGNWGRGR